MKNGMKNALVRVVAACAMATAAASASASGSLYPPAPIDSRDVASLQRGAQIFVNYCLSCHSASSMRYSRLKDIGLSEKQIKENMIFTDRKVGDTMVSSMSKADATKFFGAPPPDLSVIARSRGADYLYAYLRNFYEDPSRPSGWNNAIFDKASMPNALWEQGGTKRPQLGPDGKPVTEVNPQGSVVPKLVWARPGLHTRIDGAGNVDSSEFDAYVADLVNYLDWMAEPAKNSRIRIGSIVLMFLLGVMLPLAYFLKKDYWKNVH